MFEVVVQRTGLSVAITPQTTFRPGTQDPFSSNATGEYDADRGLNMGLGLGPENPFNDDLSRDFLTEMGLDIPFFTLDTTADMGNGEGIIQGLLSPDQWNMPFASPG